ncbi:DHH family phosphoesterase [Cellulosilyticum sp. I15G10I2]|uniref:DHH family phosphoesterase n=1 Tax=Cellulosilyticum sp. I15G10I2 TaxID=1892843 RepID=UPI00085CDDE5|nr:bifunctional oligoribonuclease/PAP phosphatase NrnA [Cellulosilyticum sp. I15G10I2]
MIDNIINVIKNSQHVLLAAHENPDGDAMGSLVGMANICKFFNVAYTVLLERIPDEYTFLLNDICVSQAFSGNYDTFISLDCGDVERLGNLKFYFEKAESTINIDHHETNNHFGKYNYVQKDASSTSELIFNIVDQAAILLTQNMCEALFTGIVTDTGGFMHSCTQSSTHAAAAKLLQIPFDFSTIYYRLIHQKTENTVHLQSIAARRLTKLCSGKVFLSYIDDADLEAHHASRDEASGIVSYIKNIKGCEVAVFIYPSNTPGAYKMSLRSNAPHDVAKLASSFGGGGHVRAAGATIWGTLSEVIHKVEQSLNF